MLTKIDLRNNHLFDKMTTKICSKCGQEKDLSLFNNDKSKADGKYPSCSGCKKVADKEYRTKNLEKKRSKDRDYYQENSEAIKKRANDWYKENKERHIERMRQYYKENYKQIKETQKKWDDLNRDKIREYFRLKYENDINHRLKVLLNGRLRQCVKTKGKHSFEYLACSIEYFKSWIEHQFNDQMSWDNISEYWHLDHVIPCASFDLTKEEEIHKCYNWSNIRPLNKVENLSKGAKVIEKTINEHVGVINQFLKKYDVPRTSSN